MWRPDDWQKRIAGKYGAIAGSEGRMFEAGVDAILEALQEQGQYVDASECPYGLIYNETRPLPRTFKGWLCIIPE